MIKYPNPVNYFTQLTLNSLLDKKSLNNWFSLFHLNVRSIQRNFSSLITLLNSIKHKFSVIGISEMWLCQDEHNVIIDSYNFVHNYRTTTNRSGGGVGPYLDEQLEFTLRPDLQFENTISIESLFVKIYQPKTKNIILGIIYCPPDQHIDEFVNLTQIYFRNFFREQKVFSDG